MPRHITDHGQNTDSPAFRRRRKAPRPCECVEEDIQSLIRVQHGYRPTCLVSWILVTSASRFESTVILMVLIISPGSR